jgi:exodeoxyribonuclease V beta subunit
MNSSPEQLKNAMPIINENFEVITVDLIQQPQAVEASAGTGKTYSIAILALRLLLEKNIPVNKILMVTFTRAAVAELELRVRSFVRQALEIARDINVADADENIKSIIVSRINATSAEEVIKKLENAVALLDETAVLTIHSFCQRVLQEFSFETMQAFGTGMLSEEDYQIITDDHLNDYWRRKIATLHPDILTALLRKQEIVKPGSSKPATFKLERSVIFKMVKSGLSGKKPFNPELLVEDFLQQTHQERILESFSETEEAKRIFIQACKDNRDSIMNLIQKNSNASKAFKTAFENESWDSLVKTLWLKQEINYIKGNNVFAPAEAQMKSYLQKRGKQQAGLRILCQQIAGDATAAVAELIGKEKDRRLSKTFDDLIVQVRKAVAEGSQKDELRNRLRERFHAVFIDEFQDTDANQYMIFKELFGSDHFLYFIGDPKQSIYGWRKADLSTYFEAVREVHTLHYMNTNFRSNTRLIDAMNKFFLPAGDPDFDTFRYGADLKYKEVKSPEPNEKAILTRNGEYEVPVLISAHSNATLRNNTLTAIVSHLVWSGEYKLVKNGIPSDIKFSDIGILVRVNSKGRQIKKQLAAARIPAVTVDDSGILESTEAMELFYVMSGIHELTVSKVNRALLTNIAGYSAEQLGKSNSEDLIARFRRYQESWKSKGIYVMLQQFMADHKVHSRFYEAGVKNAERSVANLLQLVDLIHRISVRKSYDMAEQVQWLQRGIEGETPEGDEYVQRIESDEDAVKIVTIHKSKGLEYPIVICPQLEPDVNSKHKTAEFQTEEGDYVTVAKRTLEAYPEKMELFRLQQERENLRLLYVALTRAKQQCFILTDGKYKSANGFLGRFLSKIELDKHEKNLIQLWIPPSKPVARQVAVEQIQTAAYTTPRFFELREKNWRRTSFTRLTPDHTPVSVPVSQRTDMSAYDHFVFRRLRKGAVTGNMLHAIFENVNFTAPHGWDAVVSKMVKRFQVRNSADSGASDSFESSLTIMVREILETQLLPSGIFSLSELDRTNRMAELEFDLDLQPFRVSELQSLAPAHAPFKVALTDEDGMGSRSELEGIMNGLMDLFFEWEGKFYILDWKSNYLGDRVEDYSEEQLKTAMAENNYHLQYHLYTLAAVRYLQSRIPEFDYDSQFGGVIYLFVRGVRRGRREGIFYTMPDRKVIEGMDALFHGQNVLA